MVSIKNFLDNKNFLLYVILLSFLSKLIVLYIMGPDRFPDSSFYTGTAKIIFSSGFQMPDRDIAAPLLLYIYAVFTPLSEYLNNSAYALADVIASCITIYVIYILSHEIFENKNIARMSASIVAFYPFFVFYSISLLSETMYILFLYLSFYFIVKFHKTNSLKYIVLFSITFALDTLVRFTNFAMFPFFILLFFYFALKKDVGLSYYFKILILTIVSYSLVMALWWIRNYEVYDKFIPTTVGAAGIPFYSGNNPMNKSGGGIIGVDVDFSQFNHIKDLEKRDDAMMQAGIKWIKNNPKDWLVLEAKKFMRMYRITPYAPEYQALHYRLASIFTYGVILFLFLFGLYKFRCKFLLLSPMILYTLLLTGITMVFIGSLRYRLPIEPFMIIIASAVLNEIFIKFFKKAKIE